MNHVKKSVSGGKFGRIKKFIVIFGGLLLCNYALGGQVKKFETEGNLAAENPLPCIRATEVTNTSSAADVVSGAKACVDEGRYTQAAELMMVANAYAFYDTERVADKSAHAALSALFAVHFGSLSTKVREELLAAVFELDENSENKQRLCTFLTESQPPTYMPDYMIAHGMDALIGNNQYPLVSDFKPEKSWGNALNFVDCGTGQTTPG